MTILSAAIIKLALYLIYYIQAPLFIHLGIIRKFGLKPWSGVLLATAIGYITANLGIHYKWAHRRLVVNSYDNPNEREMLWATADSANMMFWLIAGWLPTLIYVFIWLWFIKYLRK